MRLLSLPQSCLLYQIPFPSHAIHINSFSLGFSYAGAFALAAPFLQSQSPLSSAPDKSLSFPVPPPRLQDHASPFLLCSSSPGLPPTCLLLAFPSTSSPPQLAHSISLLLPSDGILQGDGGSRHCTSHLLWQGQCGISLVVAHWAGMTPSARNRPMVSSSERLQGAQGAQWGGSSPLLLTP